MYGAAFTEIVLGNAGEVLPGLVRPELMACDASTARPRVGILFSQQSGEGASFNAVRTRATSWLMKRMARKQRRGEPSSRFEAR